MIINQEEIDLYYEKKRKEVGEWLAEYTDSLKRITRTQKEKLLEYANDLTFTKAGEVNVYVQGLKTVSQRDKNKLEAYLQMVDWFPPGVTVGRLDGKLVTRMLPNDLELLFRS